MKPTLQEGVERRKPPPPLHTAGARNSNTQTENRKMEKHFKLTEETIEWQVRLITELIRARFDKA